jgi:hypothetical protein
MSKVIYDGSAASVERIMDIVGTYGVSNTGAGYCILPNGRILRAGDAVVGYREGWYILRDAQEGGIA